MPLPVPISPSILLQILLETLFFSFSFHHGFLL